MPRASASSRRTFSSMRAMSLVGSVTLMLAKDSWTCFWAAAILARATSSSRFWTSSSRLARRPLSADLSLSVNIVCEATLSVSALARFSAEIWFLRAALASSSNRAASAGTWVARAAAAAALLPQSPTSAWARLRSSSASRRLPTACATACSASAMSLVKSRMY